MVCTLKFTAAAVRQPEVRRIVRALNGPIEAEYGCRSSRLYLDAEDESGFFWLQEWPSRKEKDRFVCSKDYLKVLELIELASAPPELKFHRIADSMGLETVNSLRISGVNRSEVKEGLPLPANPVVGDRAPEPAGVDADSGPEIDKGLVAGKLRELHTLVVDANVDAADALEGLRPLFEGTGYSGYFTLMAGAVQNYEFDIALHAVESLASDLGIRL